MSIICRECGKECKDLSFLGRHLKCHKMDKKTYYDKHMKSNGEELCKTCGGQNKFISMRRGYSPHCSKRCANIDPECIEKHREGLSRIDKVASAQKSKETRMKLYGSYLSEESKSKMKETSISRYGGMGMGSKILAKKTMKSCLEKYGTENPSATVAIKEKIANTKLKVYGDHGYNNREKCMITCLEKYGVNNVFSSKKIREKISQTNLAKYGVKYPMQSKEILEKCENTCMTKYGVPHYSQSKDRRDFLLNEFIHGHDRFKEIYARDGSVLKCKCHKCGKEFEINYQSFIRRSELKVDVCPSCTEEVGRSAKENSLIKFIDGICDNKIVTNCRSILEGNRELDIYIPEKALAIEFDGLFWHNELNKPNDYHVSKTEECAEKGIKLIHIFEDEWDLKRDIVESRLSSILGKSNRIWARKCAALSLTPKEKQSFFEANHIQGDARSAIAYGLKHGEEIVAAMSFGKSRFSDEYELIRYASKLNFTVVGGASKLLKYFLDENPEIAKIVSYADRRWSNGAMYENLGFKLIGNTRPSYYYVVDGVRENRMKYQKHKLVAEGADPDKSEHEIMLDKKIFRIYDCGCLKYEYLR